MTQVRYAARSGVLVGIVMAALVLLLTLVPVLARGYPLVLLVLLAAGPLAVGSGPRRLELLLLRGAVAGALAAIVAVCALVFAVEQLNARYWTLLGAASYAPMPPLPRLDLLPLVVWPHENILLLLPPLSALLAVGYGLLLTAPGHGLVERGATRLAQVRTSLANKLVWVMLLLTGLAAILGWVGFSSLEDIHLRGHRLQLQADWIGHANALDADLERAAQALALEHRSARADALAGPVGSLVQQLDHLDRAPGHPGIALTAPDLRQFAATYRGEVQAIRTAVDRLYVAGTDDSAEEIARGVAQGALHAARLAQSALAARLQADLVAEGFQTDLQHHTSLIALMSLVALTALTSLVLGKAAAASITAPMTMLGSQLAQFARGDFTRRVRVPNRDELGTLAGRVNGMADELERLQVRQRDEQHEVEALNRQLVAQNRELEEMRLALQAAKAELEQRVASRTAELRDATDQLRQAQKMEAIGRLAGGVAHDFNNLLTAIVGSTELLQQLVTDEGECQELLYEVAIASQEAINLTQQLLAFSRRQVLKPEVVDLNDVITDFSRMLRRLVGEDITCVTQLDPALARVEVDPGQFQQVLLNLAVNARDAMPQGGRLAIVTSNVDASEASASAPASQSPRGVIRVTVSDTGCGMGAETQARIFEPFFTTKAHGQGTGLGLATVYGIVQQSGGSIQVRSVVGEGTAFDVFLPQACVIVAERRASPISLPIPKGQETVLLVEDNDRVRTMAQMALGQSGYEVLCAENGGQALALLDRHTGPIHLLLTDLVMPEMNGRELADRVVERLPHVRVLYMSGYTVDVVLRQEVSDGQVAFLAKPFTLTGLARKVREVLDEEDVRPVAPVRAASA